MESFLAYVHVLGIAVLVGKVVLLSFVVAPVLARTLDPEHFGTVVRRLFPAYYLVGIAAGAVGLWCVALASETYCRSWLTPQSNAMRDRLKEQEAAGTVDSFLKASWNRLHQRSFLSIRLSSSQA